MRSPRDIDIDGVRVSADKVVIATGARPAIPPIPDLRDVDHLTNENLFELTSLPRRLAILGGGPIGVEMAEAFARLGSEVCLIEADDRILSREEPEASQVVQASLESFGVAIATGGAVQEVRRHGGILHVLVEGGDLIEVDAVLVAVGRQANTAGIGLEEIGVELDPKGFVRTDDTMATSVPDTWAVGDVAGKLQLTHAANRIARGCAKRPLPDQHRPEAALRSVVGAVGHLHHPRGRARGHDRS